MKKQTPAAKPAPARPAAVGKPQQHFAAPMEEERDAKTGKLYAMPQYLTVPQTAERWACSESRVLQWARAGRIKGAIKPARDWLIPDKAMRPEAEAPYAFTKREAA